MKRSLELCTRLQQARQSTVIRAACTSYSCLTSRRAFRTSHRPRYAEVARPHDGRERVVVLGSGWAGTFLDQVLPSLLHLRQALVPSQSANTKQHTPSTQNTNTSYQPHRLCLRPQPRPQEVPHYRHFPTVLLRLHASPHRHGSWHTRIPQCPRVGSQSKHRY